MTFFSLLDKGVPRRLMVHRFTSWPCHILSHLVTAPCRSRGAPPWRHSAALIRRSQMPSLPQNSFAHLSVSLETSVARIPSAHDEAIPQARVGVHALWRHIRWLAWGTRAQWAAPAPAPTRPSGSAPRGSQGRATGGLLVRGAVLPAAGCLSRGAHRAQNTFPGEVAPARSTSMEGVPAPPGAVEWKWACLHL